MAGILSSNELHWLNRKIWLQDDDLSNGHQGGVPFFKVRNAFKAWFWSFLIGSTVNFQRVTFSNNMYICFLGFIVFLEILQFLNILRYNKTFSELITVLSRGRGQMFSMTMITFIWVLSYGAMGHNLFGHFIKHYSTLAASLGTLTSALLGGFDFEPVEEIAGVWGRIYLMGYLLTMIVVIMDIYASLINEFLAETMGDQDSTEKDYEVLDYLMESLQSLITRKQHRAEQPTKNIDEKYRFSLDSYNNDFVNFTQMILDIKGDLEGYQLKEEQEKSRKQHTIHILWYP